MEPTANPLQSSIASSAEKIGGFPVNKTEAPDALKKTTEEFEAMFVSYLLKVMRSTVDKAETEGSSMGKDIYVDLFDNEVVLNIARSRGLGIGDMMYRQLKDTGEEGSGVLQVPQVPRSPAGPSTSLPVDGPLTSKFGLRTDPLTGATRFHKGIDIAAPAGTPFHAANAGTVVFSGVLGGYGNAVIIEDSKGDRSLYAHAAQLLVRSGDTVDTDEVIGLVGSTGRSTGSHLHFEAQLNGQTLDPQAALAAAAAGKEAALNFSSKVHKPISR